MAPISPECSLIRSSSSVHWTACAARRPVVAMATHLARRATTVAAAVISRTRATTAHHATSGRRNATAAPTTHQVASHAMALRGGANMTNSTMVVLTHPSPGTATRSVNDCADHGMNSREAMMAANTA